MEIRKEKKDSALSMAIEGRIDTTTAPQLETELMNRQGKMALTHVSESVMEIFEVTGFSDILTIE